MVPAAKDEFLVETLQAVADKGHHEGDQLEACEQANVETCVPTQGKSRWPRTNEAVV